MQSEQDQPVKARRYQRHLDCARMQSIARPYCKYEKRMKHSLLHPLTSGRATHVLGLAARYGCDAKYLPFLAFISANAALREPLALVDRLRFAAKIDKQPISPAPIFVVGHWRSGTTHLQNLLCQDPQFGYVTLRQAAMPRDFLSVPDWVMSGVQRMIPKRRLMDNVSVFVDAPWEEEMALISLCQYSFYHVSFFPRAMRQIFREAVLFNGGDQSLVCAWQKHYLSFLKKVQFAQPGQPLLLKNPANTARITILREMFPGAKFVHIHRDPYRVFTSTVHLYEQAHAAWGLQKSSRELISRHVLESYPQLMEAFFSQSSVLPENELATVRFSDLQERPLEILRSIYDQFSMTGFEEAQPFFETHLWKQRGYKKNDLKVSNAEQQRVARAWEIWFSRLGYPI